MHIRTSAACIGQGLGTIVTQIACEAAGLSADEVVYETPDTAGAPDSGNTTASRQTLLPAKRRGARPCVSPKRAAADRSRL